jgi:type IV secretory pathway VirB2 component (pilin)
VSINETGYWLAYVVHSGQDLTRSGKRLVGKAHIATRMPLSDSATNSGESEINVMQANERGHNSVIVLYVISLIVVIVGVDILFLRHQFGYRLIANIGIVLVFAAFYLRFLKRS